MDVEDVPTKVTGRKPCPAITNQQALYVQSSYQIIERLDINCSRAADCGTNWGLNVLHMRFCSAQPVATHVAGSAAAAAAAVSVGCARAGVPQLCSNGAAAGGLLWRL
jgi:hypothetical protein